MPPHGHVSALRPEWRSCSRVCAWHMLARGAASPARPLAQLRGRYTWSPAPLTGKLRCSQSVRLLPTRRGPHPSVPVWVQRSQASATSLLLGARWEDTLPKREAQTSWPEPRQVGPVITSPGHLRTLGPRVGKRLVSGPALLGRQRRAQILFLCPPPRMAAGLWGGAPLIQATHPPSPSPPSAFAHSGRRPAEQEGGVGRLRPWERAGGRTHAMSAGPQAPLLTCSPVFPAGSWDGGQSTQTPKWWLRGKAGKVKVHSSPWAGWAWKGPGGPRGVRWVEQGPAQRGCHFHRPVPRAVPSPREECGLGSVAPTLQEGTPRLQILKAAWICL